MSLIKISKVFIFRLSKVFIAWIREIVYPAFLQMPGFISYTKAIEGNPAGRNKVIFMNQKFPLFRLPLMLCCMFLFCFFQCKKEDTSQLPPVNIKLYNQPLPVIQSYISYKWKLEFVRGGFIANYVRSFHDENVIWQISPDRAMENYNGNIYTDTTITWIRDLGVNTGKDSTYLMKFYDKRGYPYIYVIDGIFNDSLILHDNAVDGQHYNFSKSN